jgi:hypothetical protein
MEISQTPLGADIDGASVGIPNAHIQVIYSQRVKREEDHLLNQPALLLERSRRYLGIVTLGGAWSVESIDQMHAVRMLALLRDQDCAPFDA